MSQKPSTHTSFQEDITNLETTIAAIEAHRNVLGDLAADTALDLLRERLATLIQPDKAQDERKRVTVLFADVKGYTALSENLDPEDVAAIMNRLFEAVTVEIHRYGGTIDKYAGDAVMALFGAPQALENHEEMSVRAALAMQRVIRQFSDQLNRDRGFQLQMRIGLNTGEVLAGLVGGLHARSYTVMGDTVNLAARLESAAPVGGILASEFTTRKLHNIFDLSAPEQISVKGKSDEITVYQILGERKLRGRVRGLDGLTAPMIGREAELNQLKATMSQTMEKRQWQATAVLGEAGLGKTRLQRELVAWSFTNYPQTRLLSSRAFSHTRTTPYHFIGELIRGLFNLSPESDTETAVNHLTAALSALQTEITPTELQYQLGSIASILGITLENDLMENLEPEQRRDRTFLSLERIFIAAATMRPLLVLIDDLHWADALSLDFLERLLQQISQADFQSGAAQFLILSRPAENPNSKLSTVQTQLQQSPHQSIYLKALAVDQAESLVAKLLDQEMPQALTKLIVNQAQGNPFYVEEVLRSLIEDGTLKKNGQWNLTKDVASIRIPPSVEDVLAARIDRLPPDDKQITQHAAIIGRIFWQHILNKITEASTVEPTLLLLELRQLADRMEESTLSEDWQWVFHHGLIQEVAYKTVPKAMRRVVHQQVARILEEQLGEQTAFLLPLIADHYEAGEVVDKAIHFLGQAGEQAATQFANEDAVSYFSRALRLLEKRETAVFTPEEQTVRFNLLMGRTKVNHLMAQREAQKQDLEALQTVVEQMDDAARRAEVALQWASYYEASSRFETAVSHARQAFEHADLINNHTLKVNGLTSWALGLLRLGEFDEAKQLTSDARDIAQSNQNHLGEAVSLAHLGIVHYFLGDFDAARDSLEESLGLARQLNDLHRQTSCLTNLVGIYHALGDFAKAKTCCEEALEVAQTVGDRAKETTILNNLGGMYHALGDLEIARQYHENALKLAQTLNNRLGESMAANNLGLVLHDLGHEQQARAYAEHALAIDREIGDKRGEGYSLTALALALEGDGDLQAAAEAHLEALALRREIGQAACAIDNLAGLASVSLKQGAVDQAVQHVDEALSWIKDHGVDGIEYPIRVYLTSADVLVAADQASKAEQTLKAAADLLSTQAEKISEASARESFLKNVPLHQTLQQRLSPN